MANVNARSTLHGKLHEPNHDDYILVWLPSKIENTAHSFPHFLATFATVFSPQLALQFRSSELCFRFVGMEPLLALGIASNIIQIVDFSGRIFSHSREIYNSAHGTLSVHENLQDAAKNLHELSRDLAKGAPKQSSTQRKIQTKQNNEDEDRRKLYQIREDRRRQEAAEDEEQRARERAREEDADILKAREEGVLSVEQTEVKLSQVRAEREKQREERERSRRAREKADKVKTERERIQVHAKNEASYQHRSMAEKQLANLSKETESITTRIIEAIQKLKSNEKNTKFQSVRQAFRSVWSESQLKSLEASLETIRRQTDTALLFSVR
jgi:DNA repair exonuclease SbcCD ATPase subunit